MTLTIVDNDDPNTITLSVSPNQIGENGGAQAVTVTAKTDNAPGSAVSVSLSLGAGSYTVTGTRSIEIAGGATTGSTALTFTPSDDGNTTDDRLSIGSRWRSSTPAATPTK